MKIVHLITGLSLTVFLIWVNRYLVPEGVPVFGGLSWYGWVSIVLVILFAGDVCHSERCSADFTVLRCQSAGRIGPARRADPYAG